jgi:hypothetical protein
LVAQLGRALSWYGKDRWFKSSPGLLNDLSTKSSRLIHTGKKLGVFTNLLHL